MTVSCGVNEDMISTVRMYSGSILRLAFAYLKNHSDAEDIAQDVFLAYLQKKPRFETEEKKKAWLLTVTANKCKNKLKSAWHRKTQSLTEDISYLPHEEIEIISVVLALDEKYRIPIHLFYYEGYRIEEIAALTGSKAATVGTRLARARAQLKVMLGDDIVE